LLEAFELDVLFASHFNQHALRPRERLRRVAGRRISRWHTVARHRIVPTVVGERCAVLHTSGSDYLFATMISPNERLSSWRLLW